MGQLHTAVITETHPSPFSLSLFPCLRLYLRLSVCLSVSFFLTVRVCLLPMITVCSCPIYLATPKSLINGTAAHGCHNGLPPPPPLSLSLSLILSLSVFPPVCLSVFLFLSHSLSAPPPPPSPSLRLATPTRMREGGCEREIEIDR